MTYISLYMHILFKYNEAAIDATSLKYHHDKLSHLKYICVPFNKKLYVCVCEYIWNI